MKNIAKKTFKNIIIALDLIAILSLCACGSKSDMYAERATEAQPEASEGVYELTDGLESVLPSGDSVCVSVREGEEYSMPTMILSVNGEEAEIGEFDRLLDTYALALSDGRNFVLTDMDYASNDYVTFLYEIKDGVAVLCDRLEDVTLMDGDIGTDKLLLHKHVDVLGSYMTEMEYEISDDGKLMPTDDIYTIVPDASGDRIIIAMQDVPCEIDGQQGLISEGSQIKITGTDDDGMAYFYNTDTGESGSISYVRGDGADDEWTLFIDGMSEYDLFDQLPYAG